jgi:hypothetical protein
LQQQQQQQKSLWQKKEKRMPKGFLMPAGCSCRFRTFGLGCCRLGHATAQFQTRTKPNPKEQQKRRRIASRKVTNRPTFCDSVRISLQRESP